MVCGKLIALGLSVLGLVAACRPHSTDASVGRAHDLPLSERDPWSAADGKLARVGEARAPCPRGALISECPAGSDAGMAISKHLLDFEGREVRISAKPRRVGFHTELACPNRCCNEVSDQILLCGGESNQIAGDCAVNVIVGSCSGDDCRLCCSHNIEDRTLLVVGRLVRERGMIPGGLTVTHGDDYSTTFSLEDAELCYLE